MVSVAFTAGLDAFYYGGRELTPAVIAKHIASAALKDNAEDVKKLKSGIASASGKDRELSLDEMQSVAGGAFASASIGKLPSIQNVGALRIGGAGGVGGAGAVQSTIMCPW